MSAPLDYASPADPDDAPRGVRRRVAWALLLACLYAPYAWVVLIRYPWSAYRRFWVKLWPVLPGFIPGAVVPGTERFRIGVMAGVTLAVLAGLVVLQRRRRPAREGVVVAAAVLALSAVNSRIAYWAFWH